MAHRVAVIVVLAVLVGCNGDDGEPGSRPPVPTDPSYTTIPEEQVDPADGAFDGAGPGLCGSISEYSFPPLDDQIAQSVAVVRGVASDVQLLAEHPTYGPLFPAATYVQAVDVTNVVASAPERLEAVHEDALREGRIEILLSGPNVNAPDVVRCLQENAYSSDEGTGVLPRDIELLLVLSRGNDGRFGSGVANTFYWNGGHLVRPTLPFVGDLPGLQLSYVNRASLRQARPFDYAVYGLDVTTEWERIERHLDLLGRQVPGSL